MQKVDTYMLIAEKHQSEFEYRIEQALQSGFELYGFPFSHKGLVCQAMIKNKE